MNEYPNTYQAPTQSKAPLTDHQGTVSSTEAPAICQYRKSLSEEEQEKRALHFRYFGMGSLIYAVFYSFCLYQNASGITYPFFVGGTLFYFFLSLKKLGITAKKDSAFYIVSLVLLGISTCCTDDGNILMMNKLGIFLLFFVLMIHNFYKDSAWDLSKYLQSILYTVFGAMGEIARPFSDFRLLLRSKKGNPNENSKAPYIFLGIVISLPLIFIVLVLLSSADMIFASFLGDMLFDILVKRIPENLVGLCATLLFSFLASYCMIIFLDKKNIKEEMPDKRTGEPVLAITVTSLLSVIYLFFSGIQIVYLFIGKLELPGGYSYAQYAREGFFQLLFVCLLNLLLVLICLHRFKESRILKYVLTVISLCTYIMIASSALRMIMYIKYYYLTFLRIFVLWSLLVIFLLVTGVIISIYRQRFPLFRYSMFTVTVLYILLSFSRPDFFIAWCNTSHMYESGESAFFEKPGYSDVSYLEKLSADAAPILLSKETLDACKAYYDELGDTEKIPYWLERYESRMKIKTMDMGLRGFNFSRFIAEKRLNSFQSF